MRFSLVVLLRVTIFTVIVVGAVIYSTIVLKQTAMDPGSVDEKLVPNALRPIVIHNFRRILVPSRARCTPTGQFLAIYVHSAPGHARWRQRLRQTWGSPATLKSVNATLVFVMGVVEDDNLMAFVQDESLHYGDILQEDFWDTYRNLTHKAMAGLKWVSENCSKARYVLKTDDDILADVFQLTRTLRTHVEPLTGGQETVACNYWQGHTSVVRDKGDKWYVAREEFSSQSYGPFCQGSAFVMSLDVTQALYQLTSTTPFFRLDDVYVTGFLLQQLNITVIPLNDMYVTGRRSMKDVLKAVPRVRPLFFHSLYPHNYFRLWRAMQQGICCPLIR